MISFWVHEAGSFGIEAYLAKRAPTLIPRVAIRHYDRLTNVPSVLDGAHIFAALDQLPPAGRDVVAGLADAIAAAHPGVRLLNDPRRVLRRLALLEQARAAGINGFRAFPARQAAAAERWPVFVREESGHNGALTGLLRSRRELDRALFALRARGRRLDELLVVEFHDVADDRGWIHSAAAYRMGDAIVPVHLLRGRHWVLKWEDADHSEEAMSEHLGYVQQNPHEAWVRRAFDLAGIEYGRIDYGVRGEDLALWEINLNPTPGPTPGRGPVPIPAASEALVQESRRHFHARFEPAFRALDPDQRDGSATVRLDPGPLATMHAGLARTRRRERLFTLLRTLYAGRGPGRLLRAAYRRLVPRR